MIYNECMKGDTEMAITTTNFGSEKAKLLTLENNNGMQVAVSNFGARIVKIIVPLKGKATNIAFGYESDESYLANDPYVGAIVGPVAGRISQGETKIQGVTHQFTTNEKGSTLHGGPDSLETFYWDYQVKEEKNSVKFYVTVPDGFNGFPGPIYLQVKYQLTEDNELKIQYRGTTEKATLLNPTNHVYFNLNGDFKQPIDNHQMELLADQFLELQEDNLPTGKILDVAGTSFDFRKGAAFKQGFDNDFPQNKLANGYDHPWLLNKATTPQVKVSNEDGSLQVELTTEEDSVVIYTYNWGADPIDSITTHGAFTLETQGLPDASNHEGFGEIELAADETFESHTTFKFIF